MSKRILAAWVVVVAIVATGGGSYAQQATSEPAGQPPLAPEKMTIPELIAWARQLRSAGQQPQAIQVLQQVLQRDVSNKEAFGLLGDIYWETGNAELARKNWLAVLKIQENDFDANLGLGQMYLRSGVTRSAAHYLETAESVAPPDRLTEVLIPLAQAYGPLGLREKAIETIKRAISLKPDDYDAWYVLVGLETDMATTVAEFDQADTDAQRLIQLASRELQREGITLERVQRKYNAYNLRLQVLRSFGKVLFEMNPDSTLSDHPIAGREDVAANVLGRVVETRLLQEDTRRLLAYFDIVPIAERAVEFSAGKNADLLLTLAMLQERTGQLEQAAESFSKVLTLDPSSTTAQQHLAALQQRLGTLPPPTTQPAGEQPANPKP